MSVNQANEKLELDFDKLILLNKAEMEKLLDNFSRSSITKINL